MTFGSSLFPDYRNEANPVVFWDLYGKLGHPIRTTVSEMGPTLFGRILAKQLERFRAELGAPPEFSVVEYGAHRGALREQILAALPGLAVLHDRKRRIDLLSPLLADWLGAPDQLVECEVSLLSYLPARRIVVLLDLVVTVGGTAEHRSVVAKLYAADQDPAAVHATVQALRQHTQATFRVDGQVLFRRQASGVAGTLSAPWTSPRSPGGSRSR